MKSEILCYLNKSIVAPDEDGYSTDLTWWKNQKGFNATTTTLNDRFDVGVLFIVQRKNVLKLRQGDVLRKYLLDCHGVKERLEAIDKILAGEEVKIKGEFKDIDSFISGLPLVGLDGKFERLTREEYGSD